MIRRTAQRLAPPLAVLVVYASAMRPRMLSWGATGDELRQRYPGEDLIPGDKRNSLMATTIGAPPSEVWAWLIQMGSDRAGFYSWDRLDNEGRPSAERIHPEWQDLQQGDRMLTRADGSFWFDVVELDPERTLVLRASFEMPVPKNFNPATGFPRSYSDSIWGFNLRPEGEERTRLIVTSKGRGRPRMLLRLLDLLVWDIAHWIMQTRQFSLLRRRAECRHG